MKPHVHIEIRLLPKRHLADVTHVGSLACVRVDMYRQAPLCLEYLGAELAHKGTVLAVQEHMPSEVTPVLESSRANITPKRSLVLVHGHVTLQAARVVEKRETKGTFERQISLAAQLIFGSVNIAQRSGTVWFQQAFRLLLWPNVALSNR